jgi:hypothetical protein
MRAAHGVCELDAELWAVGPDHKARFDAGRVELHAALGRPRDFPLTIELAVAPRRAS